MEARADLLRCNCLWAEENIKGNKNTWQNANLIREVLQYGPLLLETGEMSMYDLVYKTCDRIKRTIFSHPRLSVKILELEREALYRIEAETGHELGITEDVQHEISLLGTNIWYADRGEYDKIKNALLGIIPEWKNTGKVNVEDFSVLLDLIQFLAGGSRFWNEEVALRVEDAELELMDIIHDNLRL